jgi:imidazoleglycerol-phosphate dehydratase
MLELFTRHGGFDLDLTCKGDLDVDQHHTVEDVGIALGEAFDRASATSAASTAPATSSCPWTRPWPSPRRPKRPHRLCRRYQGPHTPRRRSATELVTDFFEGFARGARANVHVKTMYGRSNHHKIEAIFKAFARASARSLLPRQATRRDAAHHKRGLL